MEIFSAVASAVTTILLSVLRNASETIGESVGDATVEKSIESIQLIRKTVQDKLQSTGTAGLLKRVEEKPTEQNLQVLQGELINQMEDDREFAVQLQELVQQIQTQAPSIQIVLDTVRIKGSAEIGNIEQVSSHESAEQVVGRNLGVEGDLKMGDITQKS